MKMLIAVFSVLVLTQSAFAADLICDVTESITTTNSKKVNFYQLKSPVSHENKAMVEQKVLKLLPNNGLRVVVYDGKLSIGVSTGRYSTHRTESKDATSLNLSVDLNDKGTEGISIRCEISG